MEEVTALFIRAITTAVLVPTHGSERLAGLCNRASARNPAARSQQTPLPGPAG